MSLSDRRTFLTGLAAAAALAGCGFAPVYAPGGVAEGLRGQILVDPPSDRAGYLFVRQLERRLGQPAGPRYRLAADLRIGQEGGAISADQVITRYTILGEARYQLIEIGTDRIVTSGTVDSFTGYSTTGTTFASQAAERDARERLMVILADEIVARLLATAGDWRA